ncbi:MAG: FHA domain-containing protein [Gammaproteobacteria bacterium]|nr:FHA domain-containing protein [Gammaproteobacteria bacterium]MDH3370056.1 FHA domain-containing protein [Gammaproteobacteria bacterium]MDH3405627.1 FHA domain-containing protein [Gammaproteobacteria bacterium]MDH3563897.1 FHA domain-containing protein [Gammaproteobacteria bacterium]MDH5487113.1 FHA domain-containing protein [Gammaproteobacteria bacterium]
MAKLIIKFNNDVVDHVDIKQGDMKIGRKPGCEIFIDNLSVSGEHANIFTVGEDSFIQDLGSTNGTFISNKKITKHHLRNGDTIVIGKHSLIFLTESQRASDMPPDEFAKTVIINPSRTVEPKPAPPTTIPSVSQPEAITLETKPKTPETNAVRRRVGAIFVLSGLNSGKRIDLIKKVTNLGSGGKRAGAITQILDGFILTPGQDESPKLNGRPITTEGTKLKNGDVIEIAGTRLQFYLK